MKLHFCLSLLLLFNCLWSQKIEVGQNKAVKTIKKAIELAKSGDTIIVDNGIYREGNISIDKKLVVKGKNLPILDGQLKYEVVSIKADSVVFSGFKVINSGYASLNDPCGIKIYNKTGVVVKDNFLENNFFGIYVQKGISCIVKNNVIKAYQKKEQRIGNGIHCWKSENMQIIGNRISGHRDGIYFEFVSNSVIWRNVSKANIRYGLHFMFSNDDAYIGNVFKNNGAGVAVMFTKNVKMFNNYFEENWGDAAYGLLLKEISDSYIIGNKFIRNTSGIYMEGTSRVKLEKNIFKDNGWGMKVQASCMDNVISFNNFLSNTFDISTNGSLVLNHFNNNYWDKYEGYDLNRDGIGDVPFHPLSLFAVITENNPSAMLLFRSFMITLLDKSEKILPSITPDNFVDESPEMKSLVL
ncbi:nitrous oxide reductase family maturation protein NosD [Flavobacterium sp. HBTb2-11-1]|uniref:nitrous oxide reductase family maturation protein NosD n=1 Tax=Flavobacterium sp. HBTb2-11-1 TaxID=2692212 RepID=UPI00136E8FBB|nr:nitrous oxide reductase family maturation protein NosD [Flavobacterium sp. HBTb2-11-1]MXO04970.1 nitrous oxide reductase family maturation protein NosD [Flavobacterium sp. HBTb2-11-1]